MRPAALLFLLLPPVAMLLSAGCAAPAPEETGIRHETRYFAVSVAGGELPPVTAEHPIFLNFQRDDKLNGFTGDNFLFGNYRTANGAIHFHQLGVTRLRGGHSEFEKRLIRMLQEADRFTAEGSDLILYRRELPIGVFRHQ